MATFRHYFRSSDSQTIAVGDDTGLPPQLQRAKRKCIFRVSGFSGWRENKILRGENEPAFAWRRALIRALKQHAGLERERLNHFLSELYDAISATCCTLAYLLIRRSRGCCFGLRLRGTAAPG